MWAVVNLDREREVRPFQRPNMVVPAEPPIVIFDLDEAGLSKLAMGPVGICDQEVEVDEGSRGSRVTESNLGSLHEDEPAVAARTDAFQHRLRGEHGEHRHSRLELQRLGNRLADPLEPPRLERTQSVSLSTLRRTPRQQVVDRLPQRAVIDDRCAVGASHELSATDPRRPRAMSVIASMRSLR
jgi:hypothetical protein